MQLDQHASRCRVIPGTDAVKRSEPDEQLVRLCLEGQKAAYGVLVERYQKVLYTVALRIVKDPDDAADVSQSTFVKAYEKLDQYDPKYKFYSWIYRMTINAALNFTRRKKRHEELPPVIAGGTDPDARLAESEREGRVLAAIHRLQPLERALISLKYNAELTYRDLAYVFDIPEKTVKSRLYSARQRLRDHLISLGIDERD